MTKKFLMALLVFVILVVVFLMLENGGDLSQINLVTQSVFFGLVLTLNIFISRLRKYFLTLALGLLLLLVVTYLFQMPDTANWLGTIGFGILLLTVSTYLPALFKKGAIDHF